MWPRRAVEQRPVSVLLEPLEAAAAMAALSAAKLPEMLRRKEDSPRKAASIDYSDSSSACLVLSTDHDLKRLRKV
jgi:hypothetical protein